MKPAIDETREPTIRRIVRWVSATIIIFGGVIPYIPQYYEIYMTGDAEGFSLYVCLALLVANILRILFWFGKRYELPLLIQSIIMNTAMLAMIHLCVKVTSEKSAGGGPQHVLTDFDLEYIWQWTDFQSYIIFLLTISIVLSLVTFLFRHSSVYVEGIGFMALITEAMLGVPQVIKNFQHESTEGMSIWMVLLWIAGDAFKSIYSVVRQAPPQFLLCGSLQLSIDIIILGQAYWYRNNASPHSFRSD